MSFVVPSVALASAISADNVRFALFNGSWSSVANLTDMSGMIDQTIQTEFGNGYFCQLSHASETKNTYVETGNGSTVGTNSSTGTISGQTNGSSVTSNSTYYSGEIYGDVYSPNTELLGDTLPIDLDYSGTGSEYGNSTSTGYISGSTSMTGSSQNTSTMSTTGSGSSLTKQFWLFQPSTPINISNWSDLYCGFLFYLPTQYPSGTVLRNLGYSGSIEYEDMSGNVSQGYITDQRLFISTSNGSRITRISNNAGRSTATHNFNTVIILCQIHDLPRQQLKNIRIPFDWHLYIDLDATYNLDLLDKLTSDTNSINQTTTTQTQQQTTALKDTTGSDGILSVPKNVGDSIYEQVTFTNQIAGITEQLATTVASADASEGGFTLPSWDFQGQQIWPEMTVSPWNDIPIDIKSKVRLFNTMVFAILWIRSLWNWIASIFGFEQVDDSGGAFDDMFDDDDYSGFDYNAASKRSNEMMKKLGYYH